jgi:23S rRNA-/tRNA-specific pseudouridylate synthase
MLLTIFEDDSILAVDKPSGMPSHSQNETQQSCESELKKQRPGESFYLVHRLDTGTSGVLVFAKNEQIFNEMRELFKLKKIQKHYLAWSEKTEERVKKLASITYPRTIDWPLAHHAKSKKRMIVVPHGRERTMRGKPIPALSILHSATDDSFEKLQAIRFEIEIVTGVMHQIRVHLAALGFPLIGDLIYEKAERAEKPRLGLHAQKISFQLNGFDYVIESAFK